MISKIKLNKKIDLSRYAGKWVVIKDNKVIASAKNISEIKKYVIRKKTDKTSLDKLPAAFKVPRGNEGPYVLCLYGIFVSKQ